MSTLRFRNPPASKSQTTPKTRNTNLDNKRGPVFKVHAPRNPSDPAEFSRFVASLNGQLGLVSDQFAQLSPHTITPSDYVRKDELDDILDQHDLDSDAVITSEGEEQVSAKSPKLSSRRRRKIAEAAEAAANNLISSNQTVTGLWTFSAGAGPDIAITHTTLITNLNADLLDSLNSTAFFILAGQSGGQTGNGDTAASGNLTLSSTANATKGKILFGTSAYDEANQRLGVGTASPSTDLDIVRTASGATVSGDVRNLSNTATSFARLRAQVAGSTADDPFALFEINGVQSWAVGIDNSTSDSFKISRSGTLGTNDSVVITTGDAVSLTGKVTTYEAIATAGKGLAPITDVVSLTTQGADIADTALANTGTAGLYRIEVYASTTTADGAAGTFTVNIKFTDDSTAQTVTTGPVSLTTAGTFAQSTIFARRNTAGITYGVTHTGAFGTAKYSLYVTAERLA